MADKRVEILKTVQAKDDGSISPEGFNQWVLNAMDENGKQMCLDFLEYMAKNNYKCFWMEDDDGDPYYLFSIGPGFQNLTKEELFENFL